MHLGPAGSRVLIQKKRFQDRPLFIGQHFCLAHVASLTNSTSPCQNYEMSSNPSHHQRIISLASLMTILLYSFRPRPGSVPGSRPPCLMHSMEYHFLELSVAFLPSLYHKVATDTKCHRVVTAPLWLLPLCGTSIALDIISPL